MDHGRPVLKDVTNGEVQQLAGMNYFCSAKTPE
jgi:hypothetical protein